MAEITKDTVFTEIHTNGGKTFLAHESAHEALKIADENMQLTVDIQEMDSSDKKATWSMSAIASYKKITIADIVQNQLIQSQVTSIMRDLMNEEKKK